MIKSEIISENINNITPNNFFRSQLKLKSEHHNINQPSLIQNNDQLKQLWIACYFERRLQKPVVNALDLKHTLRVLRELVQKGSLDFKSLTPLLYGLIKILQKKFTYLIQESNQTLETLKLPFSVTDTAILTDAEVRKMYDAKKVTHNNKNKEKKDKKYTNPVVKKNFIDLTNIKYPGVNDEVMAQIKEALDQDYASIVKNYKNEDVSAIYQSPGNQSLKMKMEDVEGGNGEDLRTALDKGDFMNELNQTFFNMANSPASPLAECGDDEIMKDMTSDCKFKNILNPYEAQLNMASDILGFVNQIDDRSSNQVDTNNQQDQVMAEIDIPSPQIQDQNPISDVAFFMGSEQSGQLDNQQVPKRKDQNLMKVAMIRQQMMKYDKKLQLSKSKHNKYQDEFDADDIEHNMKNLILSNNYAEQNLTCFDNIFSAETSACTNTNLGKYFKPSKFSRVSQQIQINPQIESFLNNSNTRQSTIQQQNRNIQSHNWENLLQSEHIENYEFKLESFMNQSSPLKNNRNVSNQVVLNPEEEVINNVKRSKETYQAILRTMDVKGERLIKFKELGSIGRKEVTEKFIDLLFLNQNGDVKLSQEDILKFAELNISV